MYVGKILNLFIKGYQRVTQIQIFNYIMRGIGEYTCLLEICCRVMNYNTSNILHIYAFF